MWGATRHVPSLKRPRTRQQPDLFRRLHFGRSPPTHRAAPRLPLVLRLERERDPPVDRALERAQPLVEDAERDDGDAREHEGRVRGDVPRAEDDAGVRDLRVPAAAPREREAVNGGIMRVGAE